MALGSLTARAEDWPQWRGPRGDGISKETLPDKLPDEMKPVWRAKVGLGYCSPTAVDGKVYMMTLVDSKDRLYCFGADDGKVVWQQDCETGWTGDFKGTRSTPTILGGRIYTYGGTGELACREQADGKLVWSIDILKETKTPKNMQWGLASSPTVVGNLVYVQSGVGDGAPVAVAVDKAAGKIVWQSEARGKAKGRKDRAQGGSYATITLADVQGTKQLLVFGSDALYGMNPETGKTIWSETWETEWDVNSSQPEYHDGYIFATSGYGHGCMMLQVTPTSAKKLWEGKDIMSRIQPCIYEGGVVYGSNEAGPIKCLSWPDGRLKWDSGKAKISAGMGGTMVRAGDKLLVLSERGKLCLAKAGPDAIESLSQVQLFSEQNIWATPLLYKGKLYVKSTEELLCYELK